MSHHVGLLDFRIFDIPVSVRPSFLLIAGLIGFAGSIRLAAVAAWVGIVFVSILIHELGHALTARRHGARVAIELNGLGGLTRWTVPSERFGPGLRALVAGAGSLVGVIFGLLVWAVTAPFGPYSGLSGFVVENLIFVNVFWGLLNWLPIRPLDGGHLLMSLLEKVSPRRSQVIAKVIFVVTAAAALAAALWWDLIFIALIAGWLLVSEVMPTRGPAPAGPVPALTYDDPPPETPPPLAAEGEETPPAREPGEPDR